ncbi:MAG TPA: extracellular solute-binding protein [Chloroflexota bacterium]|nr:extracellular solute-binding protein [Chloroflexota bacterium]
MGGVSRRTYLRLAAGGAALPAACTPPWNQSGPAGGQNQQPVTLAYWSWFGPASLAQQQPMLDAFKEVAPQVTIEWTGVGGAEFLAKITAAAAGGTAPDMAYLDNQHQGYFGRQKMLVDQGPLGKRDRTFRADLIDPKALNLYTYDGVVLGYPWTLTTGQVLFNRDLFQAAGRVTPDELQRQGRWTWQAMTEAAVALTRRAADGTVEQLGIAQQSIWRLALNSNGSDLFDDFRRPKKSRLDEPAAIAALEYVQDLAHRHRAGWRQPEATQLGGNDLNAYKQGRVAMLVRWGQSAQMEQVAGATLAVPWPKGPAQNGAAVADLTTEAVGIMREGAARRQDAAWLFCAWYQKDWQSSVLRDPGNPAAARVASRSDLQDMARKALPAPQEVWFELARVGVARPVFADWAKVNTEIIATHLNPVFAGERAPREAATSAAQQLNDSLAANPQ